VDLLDEIAGRPHFYDRCGNAITIGRWMDLHSDPSYQQVRWTPVAGVWEVSTIWLGSDHGLWIGPPVIFETMVFESAISHGYVEPQWGLDEGLHYSYRENVFDHFQQRYSTETQAIEGHEATVREARALFLPAVIA
jgi:hypothetical protein